MLGVRQDVTKEKHYVFTIIKNKIKMKHNWLLKAMFDNTTSHININNFSDNHKCFKHCSAATKLTKLLSNNIRKVLNYKSYKFDIDSKNGIGRC